MSLIGKSYSNINVGCDKSPEIFGKYTSNTFGNVTPNPTDGSQDDSRKVNQYPILESRILGEFSVYFHKEDYNKLKKHLESTYEKNKGEIVKHIEAEQKRLEKKLTKLFVLEKKLTGKDSQQLLDALKKEPDKGSETVPMFGGPKDLIVGEGQGSYKDSRRSVLNTSSKEEHEAVAYSVERLKLTYDYGVARVKQISYSVMSLLYRYSQLSIVKKDLEDERYKISKDFLDNAIEDRKTWSNIGPLEPEEVK